MRRPRPRALKVPLVLAAVFAAAAGGLYLVVPPEPERVLPLPRDCNILDISPDGKWFATAGHATGTDLGETKWLFQGPVRFRDLETGGEVGSALTDGQQFLDGTFSSDGKWFRTVMARNDGEAAKVRFFAVPGGEPGPVRVLEPYDFIWFLPVPYSPDRRFLGTYHLGTARLSVHDLESDREPLTFSPVLPFGWGFSPDASLLIVGSRWRDSTLQTVQLIDTATGETRQQIQVAGRAVGHVTLAEGTRILACTCMDTLGREPVRSKKDWPETSVAVIDLTTGEETFRTPDAQLPRLLLGGEVLAAWDLEGKRLRVWDVPSRSLRAERFIERRWTTYPSSPDGRTLTLVLDPPLGPSQVAHWLRKRLQGPSNVAPRADVVILDLRALSTVAEVPVHASGGPGNWRFDHALLEGRITPRGADTILLRGEDGLVVWAFPPRPPWLNILAAAAVITVIIALTLSAAKRRARPRTPPAPVPSHGSTAP